MSKRTPKNPINWHNTPVVLCWHDNFFESNKRQWILFRPQRWDVRSLPKPSGLLWEALVCEKHIPKPAPNGTFVYHDMLMPLHDSMPSFMNFRRVLVLPEFKNQVSQRFAANQHCPRVWNSFPSLAWDLSKHPRTHMWFFNQLICTGACACCSNLNYAHKMPRKLS